MIRLALYLAVGAIFHLLFVGAHFDFTSALTWLWLLGWPLMLMLWCGIIGLVVGVLGFASYGIYRVLQ